MEVGRGAHRAGEKKLRLSLSALVRVEGESASRQIESFERTIPVTVPLGRRLSALVGDEYQWLWAVILGPGGLAAAVLAWAWAKWRNRRRRDEEPPFVGPPSPPS